MPYQHQSQQQDQFQSHHHQQQQQQQQHYNQQNSYDDGQQLHYQPQNQQHQHGPPLHQQIDLNIQPHEEIPLNRLNSSEERADRRRVRQIFNQYDLDRDGYLEISEMKRLIRCQQCEGLPKGVVRNILDIHDENNDGRLDFEEFYRLSRENQWLLKGMLVKYCKLIVPSPRREEVDQTDSAAPMMMARMSSGPPQYTTQHSEVVDGAYERSMKFCPPPLTMVIFSIVEIIMFVYDIIYFQNTNTNTYKKIGESTNGPAARLFIYDPHMRAQAWRFVTYMFVHVGVMHIMMNLIIQIFLGVALELVHCWWRVALVYVAGVAAGSMGTSIVSPNIWLAGASGGVYALITAHIATIIMNWNEMEYAIVQLFVFLIFCMTDLGFSVYRHFTDMHDQVGYVAHLSGAVAGLLVGIGVLRNLKVRPWERKLWWFAITVYFALMAAGIGTHIFFPDHFPKNRYM